MSEEHLDLLPFAPGPDIGVRGGDVAGDVACGFMDDVGSFGSAGSGSTVP